MSDNNPLTHPIEVLVSNQLKAQAPLDRKTIAITLVELNAIPTGDRYHLMRVDVQENGNEYQLQNAGDLSIWTEVTSGGIEEAPIDGSPYNRKDGGWEIATAGGGDFWKADGDTDITGNINIVSDEDTGGGGNIKIQNLKTSNDSLSYALYVNSFSVSLGSDNASSRYTQIESRLNSILLLQEDYNTVNKTNQIEFKTDYSGIEFFHTPDGYTNEYYALWGENGLFYDLDNSAAFDGSADDGWLPHKKWIEDNIGGGALTDGNGTTANGTAVDLGGTINANVLVTESSANIRSVKTQLLHTGNNLLLVHDIGQQAGFSQILNLIQDIGTNEFHSIAVRSDYLTLLYSSPSALIKELKISSVGMVVKDTVSNKGLEGDSYYGGNATDNTYVQKKYVDDNAGGGGSPAGADTQIQFNNAGAFGASSNLIFDGSALSVKDAGTNVSKLSQFGLNLVDGGTGITDLAPGFLRLQGYANIVLKASTAALTYSGELTFRYDANNAGRIVFEDGAYSNRLYITLADAGHSIRPSAINSSLSLSGSGTGIVEFSQTSAIKVPVGTTAQRGAEVVGKLRYNNETFQLEMQGGLFNQDSKWQHIGERANVMSTTTEGTLVHNGQPSSTNNVMIYATEDGIVEVDVKMVANDVGNSLSFATHTKRLFRIGGGKTTLTAVAPQFDIYNETDDVANPPIVNLTVDGTSMKIELETTDHITPARSYDYNYIISYTYNRRKIDTI